MASLPTNLVLNLVQFSLWILNFISTWWTSGGTPQTTQSRCQQAEIAEE